MQNTSKPMIQSLTATICELMGVPYVSQSLASQTRLAPPLEAVIHAWEQVLARNLIQKCLVFAPDALGNHLYRRDPRIFEAFETVCPTKIAVQAEMPAVTPVCYASIFTGLTPAEHGIQMYTKPVLGCETLFDFLHRAGKRVAIVAVAESSVDSIFKDRPIDYYSEIYDQQVTQRALNLLAADRHDFILVYQQEYDDILHDQTPFSDDALLATKHHSLSFTSLVELAQATWWDQNRLIVVAPDHGAHLDPQTGKGDHGLAIPEDLEVNHYYGIYSRQDELASQPEPVNEIARL